MEKQSLNRFVSKYNLAGLVESVKWESKDGSLTTSFISDDKSVLGSVSMKDFDSTDATFGVYDTTKLTKMLSVLGDDIEFSINDIDGKSVSLKFKDGSMKVDLFTASAITQVYNKVNMDNKKKLENIPRYRKLFYKRSVY